MEEIDIGVGVTSVGVSLVSGLVVGGVAGGVSGRRRTEVDDDILVAKAALACAYVSSKSSMRKPRR